MQQIHFTQMWIFKKKKLRMEPLPYIFNFFFSRREIQDLLKILKKNFIRTKDGKKTKEEIGYNDINALPLWCSQ